MTVHRHVESGDAAALLTRLSGVGSAVVLGQHRRASSTLPDGRIHAVVTATAASPVVSVPGLWHIRPDRRPVLVSVDGLRSSSSSLDYAFDQAASRQVTLVAVHAVPLHEIPVDGEEETRNLAEVLAGWTSDHPDQQVQTTLLSGSPRDVLAHVSGAAQLLVVGRASSGWRWARWNRSVARAVLRQARCPVAVIPPQLRFVRPLSLHHPHRGDLDHGSR
jgi:nucleotide-binding universal stress UspA family protein